MSFDRIRPLLWNAASFGIAGLCIFALLRTASANLHARGIASGFGFLAASARLPIADAPAWFDSGHATYAQALLVGVVNTLEIALVAMLLATVVGVAVGAGRLSLHPLARAVCTTYVEAMRNVPVLLHIFLWYQLAINLPGPTEAYHPFGLAILSNRGLFLPALTLVDGSLAFVVPRPDGFGVDGGIVVSPEYVALLVGIASYAAAFVAEIVRAAVLAVPVGQWHAAAALGMTRGTAFTRVVLPQAARMALPPLTSEYLGILKNSSLAVAIGYQDVVAIGNSVLFETGQAIEVVALIMVFYVGVSLAVSASMEHLQRRFALHAR